MIVPARISSEIEIRVDDLPPGQANLLKGALSFPNEEREKDAALKVFGWWDLPETIQLWREETRRGGEHVLCLPRGFAAQLVAGMASAGATVVWDDQRSYAPATPGYFRPFELRWYQWPFVADLMRAQQGVGEAPTSSGKGHPLDTEVPTPTGFKRWGDLSVGDEVFGSDGLPVRVVRIFDRGILPTYRVVFSDHSDVICDADHIWRVADRNHRRSSLEWGTRTTREIMNLGVRGNDPGWRWKVPVAAVQYPRSSLPLDPYLVGSLIANGCLTGAGTILTTPDPQVVVNINLTSGPGQVHKILDKTPGVCDRYSISGLMDVTRQLGMRVRSREKRIPGMYLTAVYHDRIALLKGLMDGDGSSVPGQNCAVYHTTSKGLAGDVAELVRSLGGSASVTVTTREGKPTEYPVRINPTPQMHLWGTDRKDHERTSGRRCSSRSIVSIEPTGLVEPIRCIEVDATDHLYVVGRSYTITHNTVAALAMMALLQQRAIVIVDKAALMEQWRERAAKFLGLSLDLDDERSVGMIGQDVWIERDLTICLRQTLFSRQWQTDALDWGRGYGLVVLDEIHHLGSAQSLMEVVRALPCAYLFGLSATPARTETQGRIIGALAGPLVARIDNQALVDEGIVIEPVVRVVETDFEMDFWPSHDSDPDGGCQKPGCKKTTSHSHKDNWEQCLKALIGDPARNTMIAEEIASERGHVHLVFARRKAHLENIRRSLVHAGWDGPIYDLTGKQNADKESQEISRAVAEGGFWELDAEHKKATKEIRYRRVADSPTGLREAVILSTVADEALDIPPIDRVHVVYPLRQRVPTVQLVGRGTRSAEGKRGCVVVDYHDHGCVVFDEQHLERMRTYRSQGLRLESKASVDDGIASEPRSGESAANGSHARADASSSAEKAGLSGEFVVAITGSRTWTDSKMIANYLADVCREAWDSGHWPVILHGGAVGADSIADGLARVLGIEVREFEADWSRGLSAGNARNVRVLDEGKPIRVGAFSLGTGGTRHMVEESRRRGIRVDLHGPKGLVS